MEKTIMLSKIDASIIAMAVALIIAVAVASIIAVAVLFFGGAGSYVSRLQSKRQWDGQGSPPRQ